MLDKTRLGAVAFCLALASHAAATVAYTAQTRTVNASGSVTSNTLSAPNFGLFDQSVSAHDFDSDAAGSASQTSSLTGAGISAIGSVSATDGRQGTTGFGSSSLSVDFSVDAPTDYTLGGSWTAMVYAGGYNTVNATVRLSSISQASTWFVNSFSGTGFSVPQPPQPNVGATIAQSGTLLPGAYRLEVNLSQSSNFFMSQIPPQTGSFNITLSVPAPASSAVVAVFGMVALRRRRR